MSRPTGSYPDTTRVYVLQADLAVPSRALCGASGREVLSTAESSLALSVHTTPYCPLFGRHRDLICTPIACSKQFATGIWY